MWWLLQLIYSFVYNSVLEFVLFVLIDIIAKSLLRNARSDEEKRSIWLCESLFLCLICFFIYLLDHKPLLLLGLTIFTIVYTQFIGRVNFSFLWTGLRLRWEEYQQHTDNVSKIKAWQKSMQESPWRRKGMDNSNKSLFVPGVLSSFLSKLTGFVSKVPEAQADIELPVNDLKKRFLMDDAPVQLGSQRFKNQFQLDSGSLVPSSSSKEYGQDDEFRSQQDQATLPPPTSNRVVSNWFASTNFKRRPLRSSSSYTGTPVSLYQGTSQSLKNKFVSAFGFGRSWNNKPTGIKNEGQNLCFMNSVVQCLARSPGLVSGLSKEIKEDIDCSVAESVLVTRFVELLMFCNEKTGKHSVIEPTAFRGAVSVLNSHLMSAPGERQSQQDAAEFITWLMETLRNVLNKKCPKERPNNIANVTRGSMLKFIYGDLTPASINDLKEACRKEINEANGLDNNSYAEPIQRLSDLEWLTYRQKNQSTIDSLFTGQLVEAYHCLSDNHLSVNMQTFNILPVPIVAPQSVSGLVFLEDCFTRFCNIEHLIGKEGLVCSFCNKAQSRNMEDTPVILGHGFGSRPQRNISEKSTMDTGINSPLRSASYMSPIPVHREMLNDSGFHDNVFRTSTPVAEHIAPAFQTQFLRDAQRRCLLRQLPDCLVIQLLRFSYNQLKQQSCKVSAPVSIPLKGLDMTNIVYDKVTNREDLTAAVDTYMYDLYGMCVHLGSESTSCGHYVAYCKVSDGTWYKFDDDLVLDVNMEYEITTREVRENAYLLFYKRALPEHSLA